MLMQYNFLFLKCNMPNAIFLFMQKVKEMNQLGNKTMHTLTPPRKQHQKVMSLGIARMLQLPRLPNLIINPGFIQN